MRAVFYFRTVCLILTTKLIKSIKKEDVFWTALKEIYRCDIFYRSVFGILLYTMFRRWFRILFCRQCDILVSVKSKNKILIQCDIWGRLNMNCLDNWFVCNWLILNPVNFILFWNHNDTSVTDLKSFQGKAENTIFKFFHGYS